MIDSYDKLTLAAWAKIAALEGRTFEEDIDRQVAVLAILTGKTEKEVTALPLPEYIALVPRADFLFTEPQPSQKFARMRVRHIDIGGKRLIPTTDLRKLTTAQYIDFQTLLSQGADIPQLLSCFLVPEGKEYNDGYDIAEIHALLADCLTVPDALGLRAFFLRRFSDSMESILTSCKWAVALAPKKVRKAMRERLAAMPSPSDGDGLTR